MREIALDTESTGLDPYAGHRLCEIGCLELYNHVPTGKTFHVYINPRREVPEVAFQVHGLNYEFLKEYPTFEGHVDQFLEFIGEDPLVIHNARFDMKFINAELEWIGRPTLPFARAVDTLLIARKKFPGSPASLDALCSRFKIDNSNRSLHGALVDAHLLAKVYLELLGGAQLDLVNLEKTAKITEDGIVPKVLKKAHEPRVFPLSETEQLAHSALLSKLNAPLWKKIA
jgi:DNA polymerase-3 subunit epsilon